MAASSQQTRPLSAAALDLISKDIGDEWQRRKRLMDKFVLCTLGIGAVYSIAAAFALPMIAIAAAVAMGTGLVTGLCAASQALAMRTLRLGRDELLQNKCAGDLGERVEMLGKLESVAFLAAAFGAVGAVVTGFAAAAAPVAAPVMLPLAAGLATCVGVGALGNRTAKFFGNLTRRIDSIVDSAVTQAAATATAPAGTGISGPHAQSPDFNAAANPPDWKPSIETERAISVSRPLQLKL